MFLKALVLVAVFLYTVQAGCKNENITSNYRTLYITANSGGLVFANSFVENPAKYTPYASFAIASLSEKDSNGIQIANRTFCFTCNQSAWVPDIGFSACVNAASAHSGSGRVVFSVNVDNWEWSNTTTDENNVTWKPNFLEITLVVKNFMETITASAKQQPAAVDYGYVAVGKYRMKFSQTYISDSVENQMMPSDFPLITRDGVATTVTLRLQRQSNVDNYVYQPEMLLDSTPAPKSTSGSSSMSDSSAAPIAISIAAVIIILAGIAFWHTKQREDKYMAVASLTVPSEPKGGNNYASLDDNEVSGQEYEQIMLEQGGKEIDIPESGDDCLASDSHVDEAYAQEDPEFSADARPNSLLLR